MAARGCREGAWYACEPAHGQVGVWSSPCLQPCGCAAGWVSACSGAGTWVRVGRIACERAHGRVGSCGAADAAMQSCQVGARFGAQEGAPSEQIFSCAGQQEGCRASERRLHGNTCVATLCSVAVASVCG